MEPAAAIFPKVNEGVEAAPNTLAVYQQMYAVACSKDEDERLVLDTESFARALAEARIGIFAEQRLYHLGVLAAAEGDVSLAAEDVLAALGAPLEVVR